jgi:transposase
VVAPCSKLAFADWWATTAADRWIKIPAAALDHRRFWDAMDAVSPAQLTEIERRIGHAAAGQSGLDLSGLAPDMTSFATFIDTGNEKAPIAQRGKAKQKRHDLRLVGLALVVTRDGGVPVVSRAYPGNKPDVTQFTAVIDELAARHAVLAGDGDGLTVVYDAGNDPGRQPGPPGRPRPALRRLAAALLAPGPAGHPGPPLPARGRGPVRRPDRHRGHR